MRTRFYILLCLVVCLCSIFCSTSVADLPSIDLNVMSASDLQQLRDDIAAEINLHHNTSKKVEEAVLNSVKAVTEAYYAEKGIAISWAWFSSEYDYTRDMDLFTLNTHLDYKDEENRNHQVSVSAELYYDRKSYVVYQLSLDQQLAYSTDFVPPEDKVIDRDKFVLNQKTGLNLSLLSLEELKNLDYLVDKEQVTNHNTKSSGKVNDALKAAVESYLNEKGAESISWPWFDYDYTGDWDCYTERTRVSYKVDGKSCRDIPVCAEVYGIDGTYGVYYLQIGEEVIFDTRSEPTASNVVLYRNSLAYAEAAQLLADAKYQEAMEAFLSLGDFDDSAAKAEYCLEKINLAQYERAVRFMDAGNYQEAAPIFEQLSGYEDSDSRLQFAREVLQEEVYQAAVALQENGEYEAAIEKFNEVAEYGDSAQKIEECRQAIQEAIYQSALFLQSNEQYEKAMEIFSSLGDYVDAAERIQACQDAILARDYQGAKELLNSGNFVEALAAFEALDTYQDSQEQAAAALLGINQQKYSDAEQKLEAGAYVDAKAAFLALGEFEDSAERAASIDDIVNSLDREIEFEESDVVIYQGKTVKLLAEVNRLTEEAPDKTVFQYSTSDPSVARVAKDGTVSGVNPGDAYIYCSAQDNQYIRGVAKVHVVKSVNKITLSATKLSLSVPEMDGNSKATISWAIEPEDAYLKTGVWTSNNESVATVDQDGNVQALAVGKTVLTYTADDTSKGKKTVTCAVTVSQAVTSLELPEPSGVVYVGKTIQLKPTIVPQNAANKKLTWTSSDESIATVNANGQVKGIGVGTVTITATSADGPTVSYKAEVKIEPKTLKINFSAKMKSNDHVGNKWSKEYYINGDQVKGSGKVLVDLGDSFTISCDIYENDKNPDWGGFHETLVADSEMMTKGIKLVKSVDVRENGGRYSGNIAEWEVTVTIKP